MVSVRLTPKESELMDRLVSATNEAMTKQGFPGLVTPASLLKSFLLRHAAEAGLRVDDVTPVRVRAPIVVHPPRIRPKAHRGPLPAPTRFERIIADDVVPKDTPKKKRRTTASKPGATKQRRRK